MTNKQIFPAGDISTEVPNQQPSDLPTQILEQARQVAARKKQFPVPLRALLAAKGPIQKRYVDKSDWEQFGPGFPVTPTGPGESRRDPKKAMSLVGEVLGSCEDELAAATTRTKWAEIVGPDIAQHCVVEKIADKTLTIRANSTAWATQLRRLSYLIMQKVCDATTPRFVEKVVVLGPSGPSWKMGALSVPGRGPRDTYG